MKICITYAMHVLCICIKALIITTHICVKLTSPTLFLPLYTPKKKTETPQNLYHQQFQFNYTYFALQLQYTCNAYALITCKSVVKFAAHITNS